jgi:hypothetical protein
VLYDFYPKTPRPDEIVEIGAPRPAASWEERSYYMNAGKEDMKTAFNFAKTKIGLELKEWNIAETDYDGLITIMTASDEQSRKDGLEKYLKNKGLAQEKSAGEIKKIVARLYDYAQEALDMIKAGTFTTQKTDVFNKDK